MRILRILTPGADEGVVERVRDAIEVFNRGLDIRLRFLSILLEDEELRVEEPESAAKRVGEVFEARPPKVVIVHGDDISAVAAATAAARSDALIVHVGAGRREGGDADTARAVDRVCGLLLAIGDTAHSALVGEGLADRARPLADDADLGHEVIKALRTERVRRRGDATC